MKVYCKTQCKNQWTNEDLVQKPLQNQWTNEDLVQKPVQKPVDQ